MPYAKNNGVDQPAHPRRLICTFVVRCLDSIILLVVIFEIPRLASSCDCADQFLFYLAANPEDRFSRDKTQLVHGF